MNFRESFDALMRFEKPDLLCQFEWGYWNETLDRWRGEGLPAGVEPWDACGITHYFRPPLQRGIWPAFERKVFEEDALTRLVQTEEGILCRENKLGSALPQFLKHPVTNLADFEKLKEERLDPRAPGRYPPDAEWNAWVKQANASPHVHCIGRRENGFFGWLRELMGVENLLVAYYDQPELIHAMCRHNVEFLKGVYERTLRDLKIDFVFMWEDMSFKNGPLISPRLVREFMLPYYREIIDFYRQMGVKWITLDSDGDVSQLIPIWIEAGIDALLPFEVASEMDVVKIRREYPKLRILGGIDKREIANGRAAIDREVDRIKDMFRLGGYIPTMDHHVPPQVSFEDFKYYLARCREVYASV